MRYSSLIEFSYYTWLRTLCIFLGFLLASSLEAQELDSTRWRDHIQVISMEDSYDHPSIEMIDEVANEYSFFFLAEEHWQAINPKMQFLFLKYLHRTSNVRNLILEAGFTYAHLLNRYLATGNEKLLIRAIYDTPVCPEDQMDFYRQLYTFNQSLAESERVWLVGIDLEQSPLLVTEYLYNMIPDKPLTAGVRDRITQLKTLHEQDGYNEKEARRFYRQWHKEWMERKRAYKRYWGEEHWLFEMILNNLVQGFDMPVLREFVYAHGDDKKRELRMYNNFKLLHKNGRLKAGKYFGQFGGIHTEISPAIKWGFPTLAQSLQEHTYSPVKGKVISISRYFRRMPKIYEKFKEFDEFMQVMAEISHQYPEKIVLFRLLGNEELFPNISEDFQFVLIVPESVEREPCQ